MFALRHQNINYNYIICLKHVAIAHGIIGVFGAEGMEYGDSDSIEKGKRVSAHLSVEVSKVKILLSNKGRIHCIYQNNFLLSPVQDESLPELSWQERGNDRNYRIRR